MQFDLIPVIENGFCKTKPELKNKMASLESGKKQSTLSDQMDLIKQNLYC